MMLWLIYIFYQLFASFYHWSSREEKFLLDQTGRKEGETAEQFLVLHRIFLWLSPDDYLQATLLKPKKKEKKKQKQNGYQDAPSTDLSSLSFLLTIQLLDTNLAFN